MDEPTAGLDPATTREIHDILLRQKKKGTTTFLITHNMFEAENLCDHIALLSKGNIIENGSTSANIIKEYLENERIEAIHSTEPTLETVLLNLREGD